MFASRIVLAFVLPLLLAPALGGCHRNRCQSVCEQRQKELKCNPRRTCKATCDELHEASPCSAAMRGWEDCLMTLPADQWECNMEGNPVPKDAACTKARADVVNCISKFPEWPPPKK